MHKYNEYYNIEYVWICIPFTYFSQNAATSYRSFVLELAWLELSMVMTWQTKSNQNMRHSTTILNHLSNISDIVANVSTFIYFLCPIPKQTRLLPFLFSVMGWTSSHPGYLSKLGISLRSLWNHPDDNMISPEISMKKSHRSSSIVFSVAQWTYRCGWGGWVEVWCHRILRWIFSAEFR